MSRPICENCINQTTIDREGNLHCRMNDIIIKGTNPCCMYWMSEEDFIMKLRIKKDDQVLKDILSQAAIKALNNLS